MFAHRKPRAPKAVLALVATLTLGASTLAVAARPAVASPISGTGDFSAAVIYAGWSGSYLPLTNPSATEWDIFPDIFSGGSFTVGNKIWSGVFSVNDGQGQSSSESYLGGGNGSVYNLELVGETNSTFGSFAAYLSGSYSRSGPNMTMSLTGNAYLCNSDCTDAPIALTVNGAIYPRDASVSSVCFIQCSITGTYVQTEGGDPIGAAEALIPPPPDSYPSNDCAGVGSTGVFDGYAGDIYAKLRTAPNPSNSGSTWVCVAADDGAHHLGGKVAVAAAVGLPDPQPGQGLTCSARPENIPVRSGTVAGGQPYRLDITPSPGGANEVWVCVQATTSVDYRIVIRTAGVAVPDFEPDLTDPHPAYASPISPGAASSYCQANGGTRLLNAEINGSRVWLYAKQDSTTRANVCLRSQAAATGKKLTVDSAGGPVSVATTNLPQCTSEVITDNGPPPFSIFTSPAGTVPAAACAQVAGTYASIKADPGGGVNIITQTSD